jgi:SNF2 family DNA or RNA helicase
MGQAREMTVRSLIMERSMEERELDVQAEKRELVGKTI